MPEYLAPGLYVEEIDTGAKPIEGVSTSTAGMVGLTERGPANVPMLVTNTGDYARLYGRLLDRNQFGLRGHLPNAVDGFFRNGGRRLFISRIVSQGAAHSAMQLFNRGELANGQVAPRTVLLAGAAQGALSIFVLDAAGIVVGDAIRIGDGSETEWRTVVAPPPGAGPRVAMLSHPVRNPAQQPPAANSIRSFANAAPAAALVGRIVVSTAAGVGATELTVDNTPAAPANPVADLTQFNLAQHAVSIHRGGFREIHRLALVTQVGANLFRLQLTNPLSFAADVGDEVQVRSLNGPTVHPPADPVASGDVVVFHASAANIGAARIVELTSPAGVELRRLAQPGTLPLARPLTFSLPHLAPVTHIVPADANATVLTEDAGIGARTIAVAERANFAVGRVLRIGAAANAEFITIASLPGSEPGVAPVGPGSVTLVHGLDVAHAAGDAVNQQAANLESAAGAGVAIGAHGRGETVVLATDTAAYAVPGAIRTLDGDGVVHILPLALAGAASAPVSLRLNQALGAHHALGGTVGERQALLDVEALDAGSWGDRLRISVEDEASGLVTEAFGTGTIGVDRMVVSSLAGMEPGTILELSGNNGQAIGPLLKVRQVNRADRSVSLDANLDPVQIGALGAPNARVRLRSREFRITVTLLQAPVPALPSRAEAVEDTELFRNLSMDPRHSRYVETVIGRIGGPLRIADQRPEGESLYIRVADVVPPPANPAAPDLRRAIRLGPETLTDLLPSGIRRAARHPLGGGDDGLAVISDLDYLGQDDRDPVMRRGIPALKNIDDISLVATPGITSPAVQAALIGHCEEMRYRFAVIDGPPPPNDALLDVQSLRQNYDTRHGAIYYPWVTVPDPMPSNLAALAQVPVPPSGHMLGLYARTDIERGVHKAPANEVVRGITGLTRYLNKSEQDLLNPFPTNINVIRDFRPESRAIRAWGARVMTSDPDYKYVPVRRLLLFIEKSIERNMNWVVFEPNAEPLWTRVRQSIVSFLTTVWRNGALEGTSPDQAFFVNCDRTTMTQADIDNGRLICVIGVAAVKPAEFVIIRVGLKAVGGED